MLCTPLLAALFAAPLLAAPLQTFQGFELVGDFNTAGQTFNSSLPAPATNEDLVGSAAVFAARTSPIEAAPYAYVYHLYAAELGQPILKLTDLSLGQVGQGSAIVSASKVYFVANDPVAGNEIYVSDGTQNGTHIWNGLASGPATWATTLQLAVPGGFVYSARLNGNDFELIFTDGTPGVGFQLTDMGTSGTTTPIDMSAFHYSSSGRLYFNADSAGNGVEVWVSDGSYKGAHMLLEIAPGSSNAQVIAYQDFGGLTYFTVLNEASHRKELWVTDGTTANTTRIADIGGPFSAAGELALHAGRLFFSATTAAEGSELFAIDSTSAVPQVWTDINPPGQVVVPRELTVLNDQLFFAVLSPAGKPGELWKLGTTPMSEQVFDLNPSGDSDPDHLTVSGGRLYFAATEPVHGRELWSTDGTPAGTRLESDLETGPASSSPDGLFAVPGGLFFAATQSLIGKELFQLQNGVVSLNADINTGLTNGDFYPREVRALFARDLAFAARGSDGGNVEPHMLFPGDNLVSLGDLYPGTLPSDPRDFTGIVQNGQKRVFFSAANAPAIRDVFVSDGTTVGTHAVGVHGSVPNANPIHFTALRDELYYVARTATGEHELWRTDGTLLGTHQVTQPGPLGERAPHELVVAGPYLFFSGLDDGGFRNVFRTDGTTVTQLTFQTIDAANGVEQLANVRGRLVFVQRTPGAADLVVADPLSGSKTSYPQGAGFTIGINQVADPLHAPSVRGARYFVFAFDSVQGWGYRSLDIDTGAVTVHGSTTSGLALQPSDAHSLSFIGAFGYFAGTGDKGEELYRLTAAPFSTQLVFNAAGYYVTTQSEKSGTPRELVVAGDDLYFVLYKSDVPSQTVDVLTTNGGLVTSGCDLTGVSLEGPQELTLANGALYFSVDFYSSIGRELCRLPEIGAHVVDFGTNGSGGMLEIDAPIMNTNCGVYLRNQAPGTVTTLWFSGVNSGVASDPATGLTVPGDALWLNPLTATFSGFATSTDFLKAIPIPSATQLINKSFIVQGVMVDPLNPAALRTTNAKLVTLGF